MAGGEFTIGHIYHLLHKGKQPFTNNINSRAKLLPPPLPIICFFEKCFVLVARPLVCSPRYSLHLTFSYYTVNKVEICI